MARKLFGTDGIRGEANREAMTAESVLRVAMAAALQFRRGEHRHVAVIGKDTRLSGYMLEPALTAGFTGMGMDVVLVGPMPTPAVAMLTRSLRADLGVMISASHNPFADNGIKLFGPDGYKLSDAVEAEIEALMEQDLSRHLPHARQLGRASRLEDASGRYIEFVKSGFPRGLRLDGLRVVVDCAHGAAYKVAPKVFHELGAEVIPLGVAPNGTNINDKCGATAPAAMLAAVRDYRADIGVALDGDADRLILSDETGQQIDGDQIMALIADRFSATDQLRGPGVVGTVMSNLGLELHLKKRGIPLLRTPVGDRYVVERMRETGANVGGEQSGHLVLGDFATTGDGLVAALQVLACLQQSDAPASKLLQVFQPLPQRLVSVRVRPGTEALEDAAVKAAIEAGEARLSEGGRVLIRKSGTEPVIRVMAEGEDAALVDAVVDSIANALRAAA